MNKCSNPRCTSTTASDLGRCERCQTLFAGTLIRNRYLVIKMVGKGGFGVTYLIKDTDCFSEERILKELSPNILDVEDLEEDPNLIAQRLFQREAKVLLSLKHPGIPKLHAYFNENGYAYLVQDWIPGQTIAEELKTRKRTFSEGGVSSLLLELSHILEYLHNNDPIIIHRDIKPQNLMRHESGKLLLIDFGAVYQAANIKVTSQTLVGSPGYAPPEQAFGAPVPQSDLYATGATAVYLLTGIHPSKLFNNSTQRMEWESHVQVSWGFAEILSELLTVDLSRRTKNATDLRLKLEKLIHQYPQSGGAFADYIATHIISEPVESAKEFSPPAAISPEPPAPTSNNKVDPKLHLIELDVIDNSQEPLDSQVYMTPDKAPDEVGRLYEVPFPFLLRRCYRERFTGRLTCVSVSSSKVLYFDQGNIVYARSTLKEDRLGEQLISTGRITVKDFDAATEMMKAQRIRFGTALTRLGRLTVSELKLAISDQFYNIIYSLFNWHSGRYELTKEPMRKHSLKISFSTADIIFEGLRRMPDIDLVKRWLGDFSWKLAVTKDPLLLYQSLNLNPREAFIVSRIDSSMSVDEILSMGGLPEDETLKTVCGLLAVGMLEWVKEESYDDESLPISKIIAPPKAVVDKFDMQTAAAFCYEVENMLNGLETANYYAVLGLSRNAPSEEIAQAYNMLAKKFHPDRHTKLAEYNLSIKAQLEKIFFYISHAFEVLNNPTTRRDYDRSFRTGGTKPASFSELSKKRP